MDKPRSKTRRRRFGIICISLALLMLLVGETVLKSHLSGVALLGYWLGCFILTALAAGAALSEAARVGLEARETQRSLLEKTLQEVEREKAEKKER